MKNALLLVLALALAGCVTPEQPGEATPPQPGDTRYGPSVTQLTAAHWMDNSPLHGEVFATAPTVLINFNFVLAPPSEIRVTFNGQDAAAGETVIAGDRLSMSRAVEFKGDGEYIVDYKACWPDGSCHDGRFAFYIDSRLATSAIDETGKADVRIDMEDLAFSEKVVKVSKGARVTWFNKDAAEHFINSDPHASHNLFDDLNSFGVLEGESYSFVFENTGEFHYHCSAHFPEGMTGVVFVTDAPITGLPKPPREDVNDSVPPEQPSDETPKPNMTSYSPSVPFLRAAHFESSEPPHGSVVNATPAKVVSYYNFVLAPPSKMTVLFNGEDVSTGVTAIASNRLSMERAFESRGEGEYVVTLSACWPDGSCHSGQFAFYSKG